MIVAMHVLPNAVGAVGNSKPQGAVGPVGIVISGLVVETAVVTPQHTIALLLGGVP